jgi:thiamine-phosphate pyrophosphorylase
VLARIAAAARAGVSLVQIREPGLEADALLHMVQLCVRAVKGTRARIIVNERLDVALAAGAHGLHLPGRSMPAGRVRAAVPPGFVIGRSVHELDEVSAVSGAEGLDYLVFGTVFDTAAKPGRRGAGVDQLARAVRRTSLPVLAVGGMNLDRVGEVAVAGAAGFAAIGLFAGAPPAEMPALVRAAASPFARREG